MALRAASKYLTGNPRIFVTHIVLVRATLGFLLCLVFFISAKARQGNQPKDQQLEAEISKLKQDVETLHAEQQHIIDQLNDLKQYLAAITAGRPIPQPAAPLSVRGEFSRGNTAARVAIVEYADFECPYCGKYMRETYPQILENYIHTGKVKYFFRDLPLPMHSHAMPAARAARCAGEQDKYWEMHDSLFANQASLINKALLERAQSLGLDAAKFEECLSSQRYLAEIRNSMAEAQKMGIGGTPTFLLGTIGPDGDVVNIAKGIRGAVPYETFKTALDGLLAQTEREN